MIAPSTARVLGHRGMPKKPSIFGTFPLMKVYHSNWFAIFPAFGSKGSLDIFGSVSCMNVPLELVCCFSSFSSWSSLFRISNCLIHFPCKRTNKNYEWCYIKIDLTWVDGLKNILTKNIVIFYTYDQNDGLKENCLSYLLFCLHIYINWNRSILHICRRQESGRI